MTVNNGGNGGGMPLAKTSLGLGVVSLALVFGIGVCALVGQQQGWIRLTGTPLFICGASSAFLGFIAAVLGVGGLFGKSSRGVAAVGLLLGTGGICMFFFVLQRFAAG